MKTKLSIKILLLIFIIQILNACESREQKPDEAFVSIKEEKDSLGDSITNNIVVIQETKKDNNSLKNESLDEWIKFKIEIENKIAKNENKIKEFSKIKNVSGKTLRKAESLREDNNNLRRKLSEFEDEIKNKKEQFKIELNAEVLDAAKNISDLIENNKGA